MVPDRTVTTDTTFDDDICMYATRHTYAKRALAGEYNGGVPINLKPLAKLMGNTPKICREHYLNGADEDPGLWGAC